MKAPVRLLIITLVCLAVLLPCVWVCTHCETWDMSKQDQAFWGTVAFMLAVAAGIGALLSVIGAILNIGSDW